MDEKNIKWQKFAKSGKISDYLDYTSCCINELNSHKATLDASFKCGGEKNGITQGKN